MYDILIDGENIKAVFAKYSPEQAQKVYSNIHAVLSQYKIPSQSLLKQMLAEGVPIDGYLPGDKLRERKSVDLPGSVIRANLFRMFLNLKELEGTVETLRTAELIELRDLWLSLICHLNHSGSFETNTHSSTQKSPPNVEQARPGNKINNIKARLTDALQESADINQKKQYNKIEHNKAMMLSVRNKLNGLSTVVDEPEHKDILEKPKRKDKFRIGMPLKWLTKK